MTDYLPPQHIVATYKNSSNLDHDSRKAMTRLIEKVIFHTLHAKDAYVAKNLESMADFVGKALKILALIRVTLRDENLETKDPEVLKIASHLSHFYRETYVRMANVLLAKDVALEYDALLTLLRQHYSVWVGPKDTAQDLQASDTHPSTSAHPSTFYA